MAVIGKITVTVPRFRRLVPVIGAILIGACIELVSWQAGLWLYGLIGITLVVLITGAILTNFERLPRGWWHTMFAPLLFAWVSLLLDLFVNTALTRNVLAVANVALMVFFWEYFWRYSWDPERYHAEALENLSLGITTCTVWFASALFFLILLDTTVLPSFLADNALLLTTLVMLLMVFFMDYGTIWVQRYPRQKVTMWLIATSLIVSEIFWVTNFLPSRVEVKTYLVVLVYYVCTHIGRSYLDGTLKPAVLRRYAYLTFGSLLIVLVTARWLV